MNLLSSSATSEPPSARESLAVRHRPARFGDLVGQRHVAAVLRPLVAHPPQQILLTGGSGLGKTTVARIFAAAVNCTQATDGDACGTCITCREIAAGTFPDVVELDAASNGGKDEIREIAQRAMTAPLRSRYRIYIVDEAHGLSRAGGEAFLKLLEEPPAHVIFLLATTVPDKMLATNRGRCLEFELTPPLRREVVDHLVAVARVEGVELDPLVAGTVADATDPALGVRGALMNLAKILPAAHAGDLDAAAATAVLGTAPVARLDDLTTAVVNHDRLAAFAALDSARAASSDAAVRDGLLSWARTQLRSTAGNPAGFTVARWRFEQILDAPSGPAWTDAVVARLCEPHVDLDHNGLAALLDDAVAVADRLERLVNANATASPPQPVPLSEPSAALDTPDVPRRRDPSPPQAKKGDRPRPKPAPQSVSPESTPQPAPPPEPPAPATPPASRTRRAPRTSASPTPPVSLPPGSDPWFDDPAASETKPEASEPHAPARRPVRGGTQDRPQDRTQDRTQDRARDQDTSSHPLVAPPDPSTAAARRLAETVSASSRSAAALLRECRVTLHQDRLIISVPEHLAPKARQETFQELVGSAIAALDLPDPVWRRHHS